jgi:hypothetical protein
MFMAHRADSIGAIVLEGLRVSQQTKKLIADMAYTAATIVLWVMFYVWAAPRMEIY